MEPVYKKKKLPENFQCIAKQNVENQGCYRGCHLTGQSRHGLVSILNENTKKLKSAGKPSEIEQELPIMYILHPYYEIEIGLIQVV